MKKRILLSSIVILIGLGLILGVIYINSNAYKLKRIGYTNEEIKLIENSLDKDNIKSIVEMEYNSYLITLINTTNFKEDKLNDYLSYHIKYDEVTASDIVKIVNIGADQINYNNILIPLIDNEGFDISKLERYLIYFKNNTEASSGDIINIVNHGVDLVMNDYSEIVIELINSDYFITENINRYVNYYNKVNDVSYNEIISRVNSNIDFPFYTDIKDVDVSKENLMLINKYYKLKKDYVPTNLVTIEAKYGRQNQLKEEVYLQYKEMCEDALKEDIQLFANSAYRSFEIQKLLYDDYTQENGKDDADTFSARPGHSEHQTGLTIDIVSKGSNFGTFENTAAYSWLEENAHNYGFILRYPEEKEHITGYMFEPWHYRYVGKDVAKQIKDLNITFEEYYAYYVK